MKLAKTSIARRPGNGGFATELEFKRAILAESERVVERFDAMNPAKFKNLPINVKMAVKMHRDRVVRITREIAEIEAGNKGQTVPVQDTALPAAGSHATLEGPLPHTVPTACQSSVDAGHSETDVAPAAGCDQKFGSPSAIQLAIPEIARAAHPSGTTDNAYASATEQSINSADSSGELSAQATRHTTVGWDIEKLEEAREILGIWQALMAIPSWCPQGWTRRPELAKATTFARNRRWRHGTDKGDVCDLIKLVFGDSDSFVSADRIIEFVGGFSPEDQTAFHPDYTGEKHNGSSGEAANAKDAVIDFADLPEIEDAADFLARGVPEPPELVEGILHQGSKLILSGSSKSFKTWSLLDLGLSVAYGRKWLGLPTRQGPVLYVNLEIGNAFFGQRIRTVARAKSVTIEHGRLSVMNLRGHAADLSKLLPGLLARINAGNYALVILDPIYKVLGGRDENNAGQIAGLLNDLERLAVETGAAVVFAAHFSKGNQAGKSSIDRMSGSGVFARDADTILTLTQHDEADAFTVEATPRNHPPIEPSVVRWKFPLMERDGGLNPSKLKQVSGRPKAHTTEDLLKVLGDQELSFSAWKAAALKAGISETTFKALRKELKDGGQVCQCEETGAYRKVVKGEKDL